MAVENHVRNPIEWGWDQLKGAGHAMGSAGRSVRGADGVEDAAPAVQRIEIADLKDVLLKNVTPVRGDMYYWEPKLDAGHGGVGPTYSTAVYVMILAMPYHYIPLYQR